MRFEKFYLYRSDANFKECISRGWKKLTFPNLAGGFYRGHSSREIFEFVYESHASPAGAVYLVLA